MSIKALAHISITVENIEKSKQFYTQLLGFESIMEKEVCSESFGIAVGLKDAKAKLVMLKLPDNNTLIELFEYINPKGKKIKSNSPNTISTGHIALEVSDIQTCYNKLKTAGVKFVSEPQKLGDSVWFCYFKDYDGTLLELIQFPQS